MQTYDFIAKYGRADFRNVTKEDADSLHGFVFVDSDTEVLDVINLDNYENYESDYDPLMLCVDLQSGVQFLCWKNTWRSLKSVAGRRIKRICKAEDVFEAKRSNLMYFRALAKTAAMATMM